MSGPDLGLGSVALRAGSTLAKPVGTAAWRKLRPDISPPALARCADELADRIRAREFEQLDELRAGADAFIDLRLLALLAFGEVTGRGSAGSAHTAELEVLLRYRPHRMPSAARPEPAIFPLTELGHLYLDRGHPRLILIGDGGAGKTVAAVRLLLDILRARSGMADSARALTPVPVRVDAAGWDGSGQFDEWLCARLAEHHSLHPRVAQALIDSGRILPILDGLDRMDQGTRPVWAGVTVDKLNEPPWRNRPVVVLCRTATFDALRDHRHDGGLHGADLIILQPLSIELIRAHLHRTMDDIGIPDQPSPWTALDSALRDDDPDGAATQVLSNPWMLNLAVTALRNGIPVPSATADNPSELRLDLMASHTPAAIGATRRVGDAVDYTESKVCRWLTSIAAYLESRQETGCTLDTVWRLAGNLRCRALHATAVAALVLVLGLVALVPESGRPPVWPTAIPILLGVLVASLGARPHRMAWRVPERTRWPRGILAGATAGLGVGACAGVALWRTYSLPIGVVAGIAVAVLAGTGIGTLAALLVTGTERTALGHTPGAVIRHDVRAGLLITLLVFPSIAATTTLGTVIPTTNQHPGHPLLPEVLLGLRLGLAAAVALFACTALAAGRYATACLLFKYIDKSMPARPARFLEWSRRAGLLCTTPAGYEFRHADYRDWLVRDGVR
ncbi:hypothetical protein ACFVMC_18145 [Nocardia sp. NPDC127579]|uniref:NACHT domain-containing protein n=1 Tax=Nocardia sp. NPDC127579 TaxID=3345402 RepID=UPI00362F16FD